MSSTVREGKIDHFYMVNLCYDLFECVALSAATSKTWGKKKENYL